jgi:hypothetical protein
MGVVYQAGDTKLGRGFGPMHFDPRFTELPRDVELA